MVTQETMGSTEPERCMGAGLRLPHQRGHWTAGAASPQQRLNGTHTASSHTSTCKLYVEATTNAAHAWQEVSQGQAGRQAAPAPVLLNTGGHRFTTVNKWSLCVLMLGHEKDWLEFGSSFFFFYIYVMLGLALEIKGHRLPGGLIAYLMCIAGQVTVNLELGSPAVSLSTD